MNQQQWLIDERRRLKKGIVKVEKMIQDMERYLPVLVLQENQKYAKNQSKKLLVMRREKYALQGRIDLLTKILKNIMEHKK